MEVEQRLRGRIVRRPKEQVWMLKTDSVLIIKIIDVDMTQLLLLGKFEYTRGPIFKVVLEC